MSSKIFALTTEIHRYLVDNRSCASCLTCYHFDAKTEVCAPAGSRPPAEVIVYGCPQWDGVPF